MVRERAHAQKRRGDRQVQQGKVGGERLKIIYRTRARSSGRDPQKPQAGSAPGRNREKAQGDTREIRYTCVIIFICLLIAVFAFFSCYETFGKKYLVY